MNLNHRGTLFVFLAALFYSIGGLCIKLIPWSAMSINGGRAAIALVVIGGYLLATRHAIVLNRWIALGAVAVWCTSLFFALANKLTTAANAIVLQYTAPVFVILVAIFIWKQRPKSLEVITCVCVLIGILFFFVDSLSMGGGLGNVLALLSGVAYAGVFCLNTLLGDESILAIFWGTILSAVTGLPFLVFETDISPTSVGCLMALGLIQTGAAFVCLAIGLKTTPPVTASLISGIEPVLNPILVAVFYHEVVGTQALIGAVIVLTSVLIYNVQSGRNTQAPSSTV